MYRKCLVCVQEVFVMCTGNVCYMYRSTTTDEDLGELTKTHNPEEIDIDDDSDDDEHVEGECGCDRHTMFGIFLCISR